MQTDKTANLEQWAKKNPTDFYKLAAKLIPTDITAEMTGSDELKIKIIHE